MKADIQRPQKCPHFSAGEWGNYCLKPESPLLLCDFAPSARGADGFPINCPLRQEAAE